MSKPSIFDVMSYIEKNASKIAVRENVAGRFGSFYLSELRGDLAIKHAFRFIRERRIPSTANS